MGLSRCLRSQRVVGIHTRRILSKVDFHYGGGNSYAICSGVSVPICFANAEASEHGCPGSVGNSTNVAEIEGQNIVSGERKQIELMLSSRCTRRTANTTPCHTGLSNWDDRSIGIQVPKQSVRAGVRRWYDEPAETLGLGYTTTSKPEWNRAYQLIAVWQACEMLISDIPLESIYTSGTESFELGCCE